MKKFPHWMVLLLFGSATLLQCTDYGERSRLDKNQLTGSPQEKSATRGRVTSAQSGFTIKPNVLYYTMTLNGTPGMLFINWGDGSNTQPFVLDGISAAASHGYAGPGDYEINITGDIDQVTSFESYYGDGEVSDVDLSGLTALTQISMGFMNGPSVIDLSKNTQLSIVHLVRIAQLKQVLLPLNTILRFIDVGGPNQMTTTDIDNVIDQVYTGALANQTTIGRFFLNGKSSPGSGAVGPPSPTGWAKLGDLQNNYGWEIQPEVE
jgi:hypothetical protein